MSMGIGVGANLILEDERIVKYEYGGYNLNDPEYRNEKQIYDGTITISWQCFAEPEMPEKEKEMLSDQGKTVSKQMPVSVDYEKMLAEGLINVENCSNCWKVTDDRLHIDVMACRILFYIFRI